jgi:Raf kinase inhibitor-like YbhB/YbcL family protein
MNTKKNLKPHFCLLILILLAGIAYSQTDSSFKLISSAFKEGNPIPAKYTCDSSNVSPTLSWSGSPKATKSFAIIMDDPDAPNGDWVHWVMYNIPGTLNSLDEKFSVEKIKAIDGLNSWGDKGYNGPCPPDGAHHYIFRLYALDKILTPKEEMDKYELLKAMKGHILGETTLTGLFRVD